jgi:hypothetical protein
MATISTNGKVKSGKKMYTLTLTKKNLDVTEQDSLRELFPVRWRLLAAAP